MMEKLLGTLATPPKKSQCIRELEEFRFEFEFDNQQNMYLMYIYIYVYVTYLFGCFVSFCQECPELIRHKSQKGSNHLLKEMESETHTTITTAVFT